MTKALIRPTVLALLGIGIALAEDAQDPADAKLAVRQWEIGFIALPEELQRLVREKSMLTKEETAEHDRMVWLLSAPATQVVTPLPQKRSEAIGAVANTIGKRLFSASAQNLLTFYRTKDNATYEFHARYCAGEYRIAIKGALGNNDVCNLRIFCGKEGNGKAVRNLLPKALPNVRLEEAVAEVILKDKKVERLHGLLIFAGERASSESTKK